MDMSNKKSIKIYTEQEVRKAIKMADKPRYLLEFEENEIISKLTPIELPSDEEVVAKSKEEPDNSDIEMAARIGYVAGLKWMRDKIQGGNK